MTLQTPRRLTTSFHGGGRFAYAPAGRPSWSPDGRWIAVVGVSAATGSGDLIEVDAATGIERAVRPIAGPGFAIAHEVAYLPGDRLVASRLSVDGTQQWWLYPRTVPTCS